MGIDPLSPATRTTKRNLLLTSGLAITFKAFNVVVEKIPVAGFSINFDARLLNFLLLMGLVYFLITFVLYYFIDIRNFDTTPHQSAAQERFKRKVADFQEAYFYRMKASAENLLPKDVGIHFMLMVHNYFNDSPSRAVQSYSIRKGRNPTSGIELGRGDNPGLYAPIDRLILRRLLRYPAVRERMLILYRIHLSLIELAYLFRNYVLDGALPIVIAIVGFCSLYGIINVNWLQKIVPAS